MVRPAGKFFFPDFKELRKGKKEKEKGKERRKERGKKREERGKRKGINTEDILFDGSN